MGTVAKSALDHGRKALGVVPEVFYKQGSKQLGESIIVPDMHSRKKRMAEEVRCKRDSLDVNSSSLIE